MATANRALARRTVRAQQQQQQQIDPAFAQAMDQQRNMEMFDALSRSLKLANAELIRQEQLVTSLAQSRMTLEQERDAAENDVEMLVGLVDRLLTADPVDDGLRAEAANVLDQIAPGEPDSMNGQDVLRRRKEPVG